ncbi:MAG: hypothetical protein H7A45_07750 [Verrucomicrobiales bacterium]|nr:hypothetical protein [Verrucomicrobiales bacterium]
MPVARLISPVTIVQASQRTVLVLVTTDPQESARPAEAIRIAAGVGVWGRAQITLYLRGPAVKVLAEFPDDLLDEDSYARHLPLIREWRRPVLVERGAEGLAQLAAAPLDYREIDDDELALVAATHEIVLRF